MNNLLRISEAASLALHTMGLLAAEPHRRASTHDIANHLGVSEAHLAKVLQRLGRAGLVISRRGPKGGFMLGKAPGDITLLDVYEATEGRFEPIGCLLGRPVCSGNCILGGLLEKLDLEVREYFSSTTLDLVTGAYQKEAQNA